MILSATGLRLIWPSSKTGAAHKMQIEEADGIAPYCRRKGAAQPAHAVDAAARPRDPSFFEGQNRLASCTDLSVAAQLMGNPLGRH